MSGNFSKKQKVIIIATALLILAIPAKAYATSSITLDYTIPFRDPAVFVANPDAVKNMVRSRWPNAQLQNWDTIVSQSIANGWNPAFVLTLWIEESGAQGAAGYDDALGCEPTRPTTDINISLRCLFNSFNTQFSTSNRFADFMCTYSESRLAPCLFVTNPRFPAAIRDWYTTLVPSYYGGNVDTDLQIIGSPAQAAAGAIISAFSVEREDGLDPSDPNRYRELFALQPSGSRSGIIKEAYAQSSFTTAEEINALISWEVSPNLYIIAIPPTTLPGSYNLTAYMYRDDPGATNENILDSDTEPITITAGSVSTSPTPSVTPAGRQGRTVTLIKINNQIVDINNPQLNVALPGQQDIPNVFLVPVEIYYSGSTDPRRFNLTFNYRNYLGNVLLSPSPSPSPSLQQIGNCLLTIYPYNANQTATMAVGATAYLQVTNIPSNAGRAEWSGTDNGVAIVPGPVYDFTERTQNSRYYSGYGPLPYAATYTRQMTVFENDQVLCRTNEVTLQVGGNSGGTNVPNPTPTPTSTGQASCGGNYQLCCNGTSCNTNLQCSGGYCSPIQNQLGCGVNYGTCCATTPRCQSSGSTCNAQGNCVPASTLPTSTPAPTCGALNQPCCNNATGCGGNLFCRNNTCRP
ncbi:MAG: hypothetical protein G01um10147_1102 [Microgenomates group bacterium Gr01-1014_7]|nr:MAG: hypothetical protein G01um10147_1102 [Microgenomates group bacterium Gr01-1014_7]